MSKPKMVLAVLASFGLSIAAATLVAEQTERGGAVQRAAQRDQPATKGTGAVTPTIRALIEARLQTCREVFEQELSHYEHTLTIFPDDTSLWSRRWMEEQLLLSNRPAERLAAATAHMERVKRLEKIAAQYAKTGQGRTTDALKAKYFRLDAEQTVAEARMAMADAPSSESNAVENKRAPARSAAPRK